MNIYTECDRVKENWIHRDIQFLPLVNVWGL